MNLASPTKPRLNELSRLYLAALHEYLKGEEEEGAASAQELGRRAVADGLASIDLARIHEMALISWVLSFNASAADDRLMEKAETFLAGALSPMAGGRRESNQQRSLMVKNLGRRTIELLDSLEHLKQENWQRRMVEESLRARTQSTEALLAESRQIQLELRQLSHQLLSAQEEERRKISDELRGALSLTLAVIYNLLGEWKAVSADNGEILEEKIHRMQLLVAELVERVHGFIRELRPALLDDLGLVPALRAFMQGYTKETGILVSLKCFSGMEQPDVDSRTALYRVAQEALVNVARHARANRAEVVIRNLNGRLSMEIADNGQGFAVAGGASSSGENQHFGLRVMKERMAMVGGTFRVESSPGSSTTVCVEIPLQPSNVSLKNTVHPAAP